MKTLLWIFLLLFCRVNLAEEKTLQAEFSQGLALIKEKNYSQAIPIFSKLIKDYPAQPESYNNLAYIYATQGNYLKAQETLQAAFKNNPSYALIYENLNAIYAKLSSSIYEKAIGAEDSSHEPIKNLILIDHIFDKNESSIATQNAVSEKNETAQVISLPAFSTTAPSTFAPNEPK